MHVNDVVTQYSSSSHSGHVTLLSQVTQPSCNEVPELAVLVLELEAVLDTLLLTVLDTLSDIFQAGTRSPKLYFSITSMVNSSAAERTR